MNCQKQTPQNVLDIFKKHNVQYLEIYYYAYPQTMNDSAGIGCKSGGGQAMTTITISAYVADNVGPTVYASGRHFFFEDKPFYGSLFRHVKSDEWEEFPICE